MTRPRQCRHVKHGDPGTQSRPALGRSSVMDLTSRPQR